MRLLIFILILLPVLAVGQTQQILGAKNTVVYNPGAFRCDSISILPTTDTSVVRSAFPLIRKQGRIGWHNNIMYILDTTSWRNISQPGLATILSNNDTAAGPIILTNGNQTNTIIPAGIVMTGTAQFAQYTRAYISYTTNSNTTTLEQNPLSASNNTVMLPLSTGHLFTDADSGTIFVTPFLMNGATYTPIVTGTVNVTSVTARQCTYTRNNNIVTVFGSFDLTTTLAVATTLTVSLPIPSDFGTIYDLNGLGNSNTILITNATISADATNDIAVFQGTAAGVGSTGTVFFNFEYVIK